MQIKPMHTTKMNYEWSVFDVVQLSKEWCAICTKSRMHEMFMDWVICVECGEQQYKGQVADNPDKELTKDEAIEVIEEIAPNFNITKFIKETM